MKKIIAIEGPDACFKTTITENLYRLFKSFNIKKDTYNIQRIKFPFLEDICTCKNVLPHLFNNTYDYINPYIISTSFIMNFYTTLHNRNFVDECNNNKVDSIILLDRYKLSTRIYQQAMCELGNYNVDYFKNWLEATMNLFKIQNPDIKIYLSGDYDFVSNSLKKRGKLDNIEKNDELLKKICSDEYTQIAITNGYRVFKIDSNEAEEKDYVKKILFPQIVKYIAEELFISETSPGYIRFYEQYHEFMYNINKMEDK